MKRILGWIKANQLIMFISGSFAITVIMVFTGMHIYRRSGAYRFDLSRPGFEHVRDEVGNEEVDLTHFPRSGVIDDEAIQDFKDRYNRIRDRLNKINNYDPAVMSDDNLGLRAEEIDYEENL